MRLSEIGRALEETIALAKTETRLSRNLGRPELRAHLGAAALREGERIYHLPGGNWYDRTRIDPTKGERWFCSEAEARAVGWRTARE